MSEKPLHLHLAELPWLLFFSQGDRRRPRVSGLVSFGCQEQEEQKSRAGKVTSDTPAGLQALAAGNAGGKRGGGGGCVVSRANPPTPSLSARGRRQPVPRPAVSENPQSAGFCVRGPSNRVRFLLTSGGLNPSQAGSSQPSRGKIDQPLSSPGAPAGGHLRLARAGAGLGPGRVGVGERIWSG